MTSARISQRPGEPRTPGHTQQEFVMPRRVQLPAAHVVVHLHRRQQKVVVDVPEYRVTRIQTGIVEDDVTRELRESVPSVSRPRLLDEGRDLL